MNEQSAGPDQRLKEMIQRLLDVKARAEFDREELRQSMRKQAEENEALVSQGSAQAVAVARARARIFAHMKENGLFGWVLGPLVAVLSTLKNRFAVRRVQAAQGLTMANATLQSASTFVAAAMVATGVLGAMTADPVEMHRVAMAGSVMTVHYGAQRTPSTPAREEDQRDPVASGPIISANEPARAGARLRHAGRRIYVDSWLESWVPGAQAEKQGYVWIYCDPESQAKTAACDAFDQAPQGPFGD